MRFRLRVLGLDVIDVATGADATDSDDAYPDQSGTGVTISQPSPPAEVADDLAPLGHPNTIETWEDRR